MKAKNLLLILISIFLWLTSGSAIFAQEEISADQEQEYFEAQKVLNSAKQVNAEKYALEPFQKAQDLLAIAEKARSLKDGIKLGQASRLARAYGELAQTIAQLKGEEEKLAAAYEELYKIKAEINRLQKSP
ncbi:MAG: hypothetical protein ACUVWV_14195 [Thermodesulfobacteriota bacterium]